MNHFPPRATQDKALAQQLVAQAHARENDFNVLQQQLRKTRNSRIRQAGENAAVSVAAFGDIVNNLERIGDYALRITEQALRCKPVSQQHAAAEQSAR